MTTRHSLNRAKDRVGLNKKAAANNFKKAYANGLRAEELPSKEQKYMLEKSGENYEIVLYGEFLYLFSENKRCITVYRAPSWFFHKSGYNGKEKIKNPKKYYNKYQDDLMLV